MMGQIISGHGVTRGRQLARACDLTVLTCMDFRLHARLRHQLEWHLGYGVTYDLLTAPGAGYDLAHDDAPHRTQTRLEDLGTSVEIHQPERIAIIPHTDCGKYPQFGIKDKNELRRILIEDVLKAAHLLSKRFPRLSVIGFLAIVRERHLIELEAINVSSERLLSRKGNAPIF